MGAAKNEVFFATAILRKWIGFKKSKRKKRESTERQRVTIVNLLVQSERFLRKILAILNKYVNFIFKLFVALSPLSSFAKRPLLRFASLND